MGSNVFPIFSKKIVKNMQSSSFSPLDLSLVAYHGIKALCQTPKKCCQDCSVQQRTVFFVRCSDLGLVLQPQGPHIGDAPPHSRHCDGDTDMALFHKLQVSIEARNGQKNPFKSFSTLQLKMSDKPNMSTVLSQWKTFEVGWCLHRNVNVPAFKQG